MIGVMAVTYFATSQLASSKSISALLDEAEEAWKHEGKPGEKCYEQCPNQQHNEVRSIGTCGRFHIDFAQRTGNQKTDPHGGQK